jgi:hypothetical protein
MTNGYIYCFSNPSMPGLLKVGMTERTPDARLKEANSSYTWIPTSYIIEFAKKVTDVKNKEKTLHILLEQYTDRVNPRREFFRVSPEEVRIFFDLMDGEMWVENSIEESEEEGEEEGEEEDDDDNYTESVQRVKPSRVKGCRDMEKCFTNGQRIYHTFGINKTWIGIYDSSKNAIVHNGKFYKSPSGFAETHYSSDCFEYSNKHANGWKECKCEVDGKLVSTYSLPG